MNTFFTSDNHFGHKKIIEYCARPFTSVDEMTEGMVEIWNSQVTDQDTVYDLGDFFFMMRPAQVKEVLWRLNGKIHLILGNHDEAIIHNKSLHARFESIQSYKEIRVPKPADWTEHPKAKETDHVKVCMFHFPIMEWNKMHYGSVHLHGHLHAVPSGVPGRIFDVGADGNNLRLWTLDEIMAKMNPREIRGHGITKGLPPGVELT